MLDHVGGLAVWVALGEFRPIATLDLRVDYMRAAEPGRDLLARARCYRLTHSIGFVRAFAYESDPDDPVAAAQAATSSTLTGNGAPVRTGRAPGPRHERDGRLRSGQHPLRPVPGPEIAGVRRRADGGDAVLAPSDRQSDAAGAARRRNRRPA
ncbi:PaaI family thioesterase [Brevundimonas abyssalis]|uniref:PaaI family thioesterase n=1 Tax=Brevundimonas abyssalis TaxID=1125965 RepID=UPI0035A26083